MKTITLYQRFKKLYMKKHSVPLICRELNIDMETYDKLRAKVLRYL